MRAVLTGNFVVLSVYIQNLGDINTSNTAARRTALEQKEDITPLKNRWQKLIRLRTEINIIETRKRTKNKDSMKQRLGSVQKSLRLTNSYSN